jgi:hypothetical protein
MPKNRSNNQFRSILLFPEKEAKSVSSASQKVLGPKIFREAEPRGFGGLPPRNGRFVEYNPSFISVKSTRLLSVLVSGLSPVRLND